MTAEEKIKTFEIELGYINDGEIRAITSHLISLVPDYFFKVPASSTGKYHPNYTVQEGGLVLHTKAACKMAHDLMQLDSCKGSFGRQDYLMAALILHDSYKKGNPEQQYTCFDHPLLAAKFVKVESEKYCKEVLSMDCEHVKEYGEIVGSLISSHMGQWNTSKYDPQTVLPTPKSLPEIFVHMCDYLASRKYIEIVNFEKI